MTGTRVTATALDTMESESVVITNDWTIICDGDVYLYDAQTHANGTVVLTIKRRPS